MFRHHESPSKVTDIAPTSKYFFVSTIMHMQLKIRTSIEHFSGHNVVLVWFWGAFGPKILA